ncbi:MAG: metallophosphoesterase [Candidatus Latescibacterota bacterium]
MFTVIQITDTHVFADKEVTYGADAAKVLQIAIEDIHTRYPDAAFVVHTGDVAGYDGCKEDCERFGSIIRSLSIPILYVPGNHDKRSVLRSELLGEEPTEGPMHWSFVHGGWLFVGLDSSAREDMVGSFPTGELAWLGRNLDAYEEFPALIFFHHHVLPVGVRWLDELALADSLKFLETIAPYPQVKYVVGGHVHLEKSLYYGGRSFLSTPSLCEQYPAHVQTFAVHRISPGYRVFRFQDDGSVETFVRRLNYMPSETEYDVYTTP